MFHLKLKPRPPSLAGFVTIGHEVDSSAIIRVLGFLPNTAVLRSLKN